MHQNHVDFRWPAWRGAWNQPNDPSQAGRDLLGLVSAAETAALRASLSIGKVPQDLLDKLNRLHAEDYKEHYLQRQSWVLLALLVAAGDRGFNDISPWDRERLVRMIAYVRKDDDAIPDGWPHGFDDDHDLMRLTCNQLRPVLDAFKSWRLKRQVPRLWEMALGCGSAALAGGLGQGFVGV
jgi:hypothetical protein